MTWKRAIVALAGLTAAGCAEDYRFRDHPEFASAAGVVTMTRNGVIIRQFPASSTSMDFEGGLKVIRPGDPDYKFEIEISGGLKPGETKPIYVILDLPENSKDNSSTAPSARIGNFP